MNDLIVCKLSPVKILAVSAAPLRELLNFLIYGRHVELLTERVRRQPSLSWEEIPLTIKELGIVLRAESRDKNGKLFLTARGRRNTLPSFSTTTERSFGFIISAAASGWLICPFSVISLQPKAH